jgi:hypothetical protein
MMRQTAGIPPIKVESRTYGELQVRMPEQLLEPHRQNQRVSHKLQPISIAHAAFLDTCYEHNACTYVIIVSWAFSVFWSEGIFLRRTNPKYETTSCRHLARLLLLSGTEPLMAEHSLTGPSPNPIILRFYGRRTVRA